ncbi:hypothetical protein DFP73DRAFT_591972 [Morchella snyderi]|nr:hypothetical protein DFP73DRAFT_591972 [Morchella snyderi]
MSESTMMYQNMHECSAHGMQAFITMKNQKRIYEEDNNPVQEMQKPHKRVRITDVERSRDEQRIAPKQTDGDNKCTSASVVTNDKSCKKKPCFFLPVKGNNIQFLHLHHPESGDLEKVMLGVNPPLVWSSIHMPVNSINPQQQPGHNSPHIESLRGPSRPTFHSTGSSNTRPEVNRMAHRAHLTYDYWFYDAGQEHSENGVDEDEVEDEVTERDSCSQQSPPSWYIGEDMYGRLLNTKMELFNYN